MAVAIAVTRERRDGETRCAATPETVKKLIGLGATVTVEAGTGTMSCAPAPRLEAVARVPCHSSFPSGLTLNGASMIASALPD